MNGEQAPGWRGDALPVDRLGVIARDLGEIVEKPADERPRRLDSLLFRKISDRASDLVSDVTPKRHVHVCIAEVLENNAGVREA